MSCAARSFLGQSDSCFSLSHPKTAHPDPQNTLPSPSPTTWATWHKLLWPAGAGAGSGPGVPVWTLALTQLAPKLVETCRTASLPCSAAGAGSLCWLNCSFGWCCPCGKYVSWATLFYERKSKEPVYISLLVNTTQFLEQLVSLLFFLQVDLGFIAVRKNTVFYLQQNAILFCC